MREHRDGITDSLSKNLETWSNPGVSAKVNWKQDLEKSIKIEKPVAEIELCERGFLGELARFGHGLQRSFLLSIIQELSMVPDENQPTLILGVEEPELFQHPPQIRHLVEVLNNLALRNSQILVCSHSPFFIPGDKVEAVRMVRESGEPSVSNVTQVFYKDLSQSLKDAGQKSLKEKGMIAKLYSSLNPLINEMFFCKVLVLVEGIEDSAYIYTSLTLSEKLNEFRKFGCHIVPVGGKNMLIKPIAIANLLKIPVFVVFDGDTDKKKECEIKEHRKDNGSIQSLLGEYKIEDWPETTKWSHNYVMWRTNITSTIKEEFGDEWEKYKEKARSKYGQTSGLEKNPLAIAYTLEEAWKSELKSSSLVQLIERLLRFAEKSSVLDLLHNVPETSPRGKRFNYARHISMDQ